MTMILQFLVATVAVGLSLASQVPPYRRYAEELDKANKTLVKNMLSLKGNMKFLDDYRRDYVEIINVINYHAKHEAGCPDIIRSYNELYYRYLNISAPEAISDPEKVLSEVEALLDEVHENINEVIDLIDSCTIDSKACDELVDDTINMNPDQYRKQAAVFIAAAKASSEFNLNNAKYEEVSKDLKADQYVCYAQEDLKSIVHKVGNVYEELHHTPIFC